MKGTDLIKNFEGLVLHAYKDTAGIPTIGFGCIEYPDGRKVQMGDKITKEQADEYFLHEYNLKKSAVEKMLLGVKLNQNQMDALISLAYNIGTEGLRKSTLLKKVKNNPRDPYIRECFLMWNRITKNGKKEEDKGLTVRRKKEADLYFTPVQ